MTAILDLRKMKDGPNEYFLASSECKGSQQKGEWQVEEKRGEVRLCAIPDHKVYLRKEWERGVSLRGRER